MRFEIYLTDTFIMATELMGTQLAPNLYEDSGQYRINRNRIKWCGLLMHEHSSPLMIPWE